MVLCVTKVGYFAHGFGAQTLKFFGKCANVGYIAICGTIGPFFN